jgi:hypothetical protein
MKIIRYPSAVINIPDPDIRALVELRMAQLCDGSDDHYDADELGYLVVVDLGDTVAALEAESGCPIMHNYFDPDIRYGNAEFVPSAEAIEDHGYCYELTYILGGDSGIGIFVPKTEGIDAQLLAMCTEFAEPVRKEPVGIEPVGNETKL